MGGKDSSAFTLTKLYLVLYNLACCSGWAYVLFCALKSILKTQKLDEFVGDRDSMCLLVLMFTQNAAIMEVLHAALGFVRSPVAMTAIQVSSRVGVLYYLLTSPNAIASNGAGLMVLSWSLVEVPRYMFYFMALITGDATKGTPYPLFWLRYSLFMVLYPSGITGEILTYYEACNDPASTAIIGGKLILYSMLAVYIIGSPTMILNMAGNRKSAFKKRFAKPPPPPRGLVFPSDEKNVRSSTKPAKAILAAAVGAVNPEKAAKIMKERNWRFGYVKHFVSMVEEQCTSPQNALKIAQAGLDKARDLFEFHGEDGTTMSLKQAMTAKNDTEFFTGFVQGEASPDTILKELEVPYKGMILRGETLRAKVKEWVQCGTIEQSCGDEICKVIDNPQWISQSTLKNQYFCLLGAGSAMGPFEILMRLGANVVAIDLDRPQIWKRLITRAKKSSGTLTFPMKVDPKGLDMDATYASSGCNLFTETPIIRDWLLSIYPGKSMCVGSYAYLDGALHVQVSLAMDAICCDLSEKRPNTSLAYLCTPTDAHLIPKEAWEASVKNYKDYSGRIFCMFMRLFGKQFLVKNVKAPVSGDGGEYYMVNGLVVNQGPNYALAKRMQHWRAIVARSKGCIVSSNIAPSTSTVSVVHNRQFAWAYEGMPYFKPFEIMAPEVSNSVMTALLMFDLSDKSSSGNPENKLNNPNQLFQYGGFHGGVWRCAYTVGSIGESSVVIYFSRQAKPYFIGACVVTAAVVGKLMMA